MKPIFHLFSKGIIVPRNLVTSSTFSVKFTNFVSVKEVTREWVVV